MLCCASVQHLVRIRNSISENFALWLSPSYVSRLINIPRNATDSVVWGWGDARNRRIA